MLHPLADMQRKIGACLQLDMKWSRAADVTKKKRMNARAKKKVKVKH